MIDVNYVPGWRGPAGQGSVEESMPRLVFLFVPFAPVALAVLGSRLHATGALKPELFALLAICIPILLGLSVLLWHRIRRRMTRRRIHRQALDAAPVAITDMDGHILYWSKGCEALYGWSARSVRGKRKQTLLAHGHQPERRIAPAEPEDFKEVELIERRRDGRVIHVREQARLLDPQLTGPRLVVLVMTDVTEQHAQQARQAELLEELAHASRLSSVGEAAAGLIHELRQPLAAITNFLGIAELILDRPEMENDQLRATLMLASEQAMRAGDIVQRFQAFLTKRPDQIRPEPVMATIVGAIDLSMTGMDAQNRIIDYQNRSRHDFMMADRIQIQQVLINLIRNAIEAQETQEVEKPFIWLTTEDWVGNRIRITVRDRGPGIADQVLRASYRPFTSTKKGGMGLGLSICRRIVESHGGTIHAENAPDGGASISFTIPAAEHGKAKA